MLTCHLLEEAVEHSQGTHTWAWVQAQALIGSNWESQRGQLLTSAVSVCKMASFMNLQVFITMCS